MDSHFHYDTSHYKTPLHQVPVTNFFGSVSHVQPTPAISLTFGDGLDPQRGAATETEQRQTCDASYDKQKAAVATTAANEVTSAAAEAEYNFGEVKHGPVELLQGSLFRAEVYNGLLALVLVVGIVTIIKQ